MAELVCMRVLALYHLSQASHWFLASNYLVANVTERRRRSKEMRTTHKKQQIILRRVHKALSQKKTPHRTSNLSLLNESRDHKQAEWVTVPAAQRNRKKLFQWITTRKKNREESSKNIFRYMYVQQLYNLNRFFPSANSSMHNQKFDFKVGWLAGCNTTAF